MNQENKILLHSNGERRSIRLLIAFAGFSLLIGVVVYILDRSPSSVYFLSGWSNNFKQLHADSGLTGGYFGNIGYYLPTMLHTFAFILLTMALVIPYPGFKRYILRVCLVWFVIESLFELAQMDTIANRIADWFPAGFAEIPFIENIPDYFTAGTFDVLDIISIMVGAIAAYLMVNLIARNEFINVYGKSSNEK